MADLGRAFQADTQPHDGRSHGPDGSTRGQRQRVRSTSSRVSQRASGDGQGSSVIKGLGGTSGWSIKSTLSVAPPGLSVVGSRQKLLSGE